LTYWREHLVEYQDLKELIFVWLLNGLLVEPCLPFQKEREIEKERKKKAVSPPLFFFFFFSSATFVKYYPIWEYDHTRPHMKSVSQTHKMQRGLY
jgi:hypothetical protein